MDRRNFLCNLGAVAGIGTLGAHHASFYPPARERRADVVIIGGGTGGVAAALGALRSGSRVILTEETDWIGGQLTQQAVPPDEHPWIEQFGAPASYLDFRRRVRAFYRGAYPLVGGLPDAFNPGNCGVSRICHEPRVALAVLEDMLARYLSSGRLTVLLEHVDGAHHVIERPAEYAFWRDYVPNLTPAWPGPLLRFTYSHPITLEPRTLPFDPRTDDGGWWTYRRLIDPGNFTPGTYPGGITLVNWPQNDYLLGNFVDVDDAEKARHLDGALSLSRSLFYWLQTEAPRPDGGEGWPGLRLRGDLTGTRHGFAKRPYIREARRIRAEFTVLEQHVGLEARMAETGLPQGEVTASSFPDSVGIGSYRIDLHPSTGGDNYIDIGSLPFEIPLGALLPVRMENLLPAAKNIGTTHITNGCYRLHPVEWNIGEAAGQLAAFCIHGKHAPRQVRANPDLLEDFRQSLKRQGVEIRWPDPARRAR